MVFDQDGIEGVIIDHFKKIFNGQDAPKTSDTEEIIDDNAPEGINAYEADAFEAEVCSPYTVCELDEILDSLPIGKASSTDQIPNELLKHTTSDSRLYLQIFLNKIMEKGEVPEALNQGKCVLIYKVRITIKQLKVH